MSIQWGWFICWSEDDPPRQQAIDFFDSMVGDALQRMAQAGLWIDGVEIGRTDQVGKRPVLTVFTAE